MSDETHITWHDHAVSRGQRESLFGHRGCVVWFTGLSGSGKSTIANLVDHKLHLKHVRSYVLDGDNIRHGLNASVAALVTVHGDDFARRFGLGFSAEDRQENIRRIGEVARLFCDAGIVVLTAFVSPYRRDRQLVREKLGAGDFVEVFVKAPLEICEARDPKGLYRKARRGELPRMTGIDDPYESPEKAEVVLDSANHTAESLADDVIAYLEQYEMIGR
jgi:adenylylsulfate kinase